MENKGVEKGKMKIIELRIPDTQDECKETKCVSCVYTNIWAAKTCFEVEKRDKYYRGEE